MAPTTPIRVALTFFNAIQDDTQYYLSVNEVNGISWSSLPLKYGESVEFSKTVPTPVGYRGFDYSQYQVVRLTANYIVADMFPFPLDNSNSLLVVAWNDAQNQIYTDALGSYGASNVACIYGPSRRVALFYPMLSAVLTFFPFDRPQPRLPAADELQRHVAHHLHPRRGWSDHHPAVQPVEDVLVGQHRVQPDGHCLPVVRHIQRGSLRAERPV